MSRFDPFITDAGELSSADAALIGARYGVWAYDEARLRFQVIATGPDLFALAEEYMIPLERVYKINPSQEK